VGALQHDTADMVSLLGGWPEGEEEATHDSITDCHMFANMHFEPAETCRSCLCHGQLRTSSLHNSRIAMQYVTDRYAPDLGRNQL
jgi:hypothetical protein